MILSIKHVMLVSDPDEERCRHHVRLFFEKSQLVHYDSIEFADQACINGTDPAFAQLLEQGLEENRRRLRRFLAKLKQEGCASLDDLLDLEQGFKSKLLHTTSHLLDGFFGIDSYFYDIDEISHWITAARQEQLERVPEECWLVRLTGKSVYGQGFEKKGD